MKKFLCMFVLLLSSSASFAYEYKYPVLNDVKDTQVLVYNVDKQAWYKAPADVNKNINCEKEIVYTKFVSSGSGSYSEYQQGSENMSQGIGSTYEFLDETDLISYNGHSLKFYKLTFDGEKIVSTELKDADIQKYFPDVEIVKISEFKNNKIVLKKPWFREKFFMLVNDTKTDFFRYKFEEVKDYQIIKGVFKATKGKIKPQIFVFSHFAVQDAMYPPLEIKVKNSL